MSLANTERAVLGLKAKLAGGPPLEPMVSFASYEALQAKYDALVQTVLLMKREGFAAPTVAQEIAQSPTLPVQVQKAITDLGVDPSTERYLTRQAWEMIRTGVAEEEIAARITAGEPVEL